MNKTPYYLMAVLASLFWGFGFVGSSWAVETMSSAWVNGLRFSLSALIMVPFVLMKCSRTIAKKEWLFALLASLMLAVVMLLQTESLKYTTIAKCGFITILYVLITPLMTRFFYREKFSSGFVGSLILSLVGVAFLFELQFNNFNYGDFLALLTALFFAAHLLLIDRVVKDPKIDILRFNFLQILFVGILCTTLAMFQTGPLNISQLISLEAHKYLSLVGIVSTALFSTSLAFFFQMKSQVELKPHLVGLIFLLECGFAALFGNIFLGENLSILSLFGCMVLFLAVSYGTLKDTLNLDFSRSLKPTFMVFAFIILSSFC